MKTVRSFRQPKGALPTAGIVAVLCVIAFKAAGIEVTTTEPTTQPATATTKPYMPKNLSEAAIDLTYRQKVALSAVRDGAHWREKAFYVMLARTAELVDPEASSKEFPALESPAIGSLLDYPNRYRAQKIRVTMRVHMTEEYVSGSRNWAPDRDWPRGKKLWHMTGFRLSELGANSEKKTPAQEIVVFSLVDPAELLGKPKAVSDKGACTYGQYGKTIELAGIFYKTYKDEIVDSNSKRPAKRDFPVVIAYHLKASKVTSHETDGSTAMRNAVIVVVVAMMGLLYTVRKRAKQVKAAPIGSGAAGNVKYTPLRNVEEDNLPNEERETQPVDQDLVNAVQAFESKRNTDGTDDKS
jgi:hypothetical protein